MIDRHLRRERELASLYATARALTALGDVNSVLASIVKHAHDLMGTDLTYLSVFDDDYSELRLLAAEGDLSPAFRRVRVPGNTGIGGRVVETKSPAWVGNYLADPTLRHNPGFDAVVKDEGIVALLGVPLRDGARVFGILYAADRVEREFDFDEIALLSAFADHAAVALLNARLYEESQRTLAELREAYATIERSIQVHEALTSVVLAGGGGREVADLLVGALGGHIAVYTRADRLLVAAPENGSAPEHLPTRGHLKDALGESQRMGRCVTVAEDQPDRAVAHHSVVAMLAGDSYLGAVVRTDRQRPTTVAELTLERAAQILALMLLKQDAAVEAEERLREELLTELIDSPRPIRAELAARAASRSVAVDRCNALLVAASDAVRSAELTRRLHNLSGEWSGLAGEYLGAATMVFHATELDSAVAVIHRRLRSTGQEPILVCATPIPATNENMRGPFLRALRSVKILRAIRVTDRAITTTHMGLYAVLFDPDRGDDLVVFLADTLGSLVEYDRRRGTDLVGTLAAYFDNGFNLTRTSKILHVHMNTLVKRMERIESILGHDWQDPERSLTLQLAVRLHNIANAVGSGT